MPFVLVEGHNPKLNVPGQAIPLDAPLIVARFLHDELSVDKLSSIQGYLWMCGRPHNVHPLHWHRMFLRSIVVTENPSLHLTWYRDIIHVKPLPACLLDGEFWKTYIVDEKLNRDARGFLLSYVELIQHESDYNIAVELGLLPRFDGKRLPWETWCSSVQHVRGDYHLITKGRYAYGELRLSRLNFIYSALGILSFGTRVDGMALLRFHRNYTTFLRSSFGASIIVFVYLSLILTAEQTILSTSNYPPIVSDVFYWFCVVILIAVPTIVVGILFAFLVIFTWNAVEVLKGFRSRYVK